MRSRSSPLVSLLGVCVALTPAVAQLTQCNGVNTGTNYKVLVDEIRLESGGPAANAVPIELLRNSIDGALEKVRQNALGPTTAGARVVYLNCQGRHPSSTNDFGDDFVRSLLADHAILELWGTLANLGSSYSFAVYYMMFPLSTHANATTPHHVTTTATMAHKPDAEAVLKYLTATCTDLPAYFALSAGVEAFADKRYEQALRLLCEARTRLRKQQGAGEFATFADTLAGQAADSLRRPGGDSNAITLLTPEQAKNFCAFATGRS